MKLTHDRFLRVIASLKLDESGGTAAEQRRDPRLEMRATLTITPLAHGKPGGGTGSGGTGSGGTGSGGAAGGAAFNVRLHDISCGGVGILHHGAMGRGTQFVVDLPEGDGLPPTRVLCTARHSRPAGPYAFLIGAEFTRIFVQPGTAPVTAATAGAADDDAQGYASSCSD